ncbi:hypothetical protein B0T24DRAFT_550712 [Lasiosphaeria ovina]|uniref:Xylanolytic transcriptional activator regulatory domain-containing protein n=1 Tax=Lasiosphaeria ovina TaxID=92902 RepID=A0AAE0KIF0_9PEZI|nr:hypothetical protein B0T24DRAFT_550712 [Lasiosphaeria ovina]
MHPSASRRVADGTLIEIPYLPIAPYPCPNPYLLVVCLSVHVWRPASNRAKHRLKCNRESPCQNCKARGGDEACKFHGPKPNAGGSGAAARANANGQEMLARIHDLEDLVKSLIEKHQAFSTGSPPVDHEHDPAQPATVLPDTPDSPPQAQAQAQAQDAAEESGAGKTVMDGIHSVYRGVHDWQVVLQEINNLRSTWNNQDYGYETDYSNLPIPSHTVDGSSLLFNQAKPIERIEIISTLPPKPEVDRMIAFFFNRSAFPIAVPPILHEPTFIREYNEHWKNPSQTNLIWLGLLFSILGITMLAYHQYGEPPQYEGIAESLFSLYRTRTSQCLLAGDMAKCLPYTVETLRFNATAELNRRDDNHRGLWIMTGVVVRTAINMGYHRDPSQFPDISPMQAEYRRRVWISVVSMDDMASFLGGFPRMVSGSFADAAECRNLHEWELSAETTVLPLSRPLTEATPVTYLIVKGRLFRALGRVADFNSAPNTGAYDAVLDIDRAVYESYQSFPPHMRIPPVGASSGGSSKKGDGDGPRGGMVQMLATFSNLSLFGMYHKGMCALHRKFLAKGRTDSRYKFSHDRCISSALALVESQQLLIPSLYRMAQTRQIMTLAFMVLILELELRRKAPSAEAAEPLSPDSGVLLQALDKSRALWADAGNVCEEAWRSHQLLEGMFSSFRVDTSPGTASSSLQTPPDNITPLEILGLGPQFDAMLPAGNFSFYQEWANVDLDWAAYDTFIEESGQGSGPIYK